MNLLVENFDRVIISEINSEFNSELELRNV